MDNVELLSNIDLTNFCKKLNIPLNDVISKDLLQNIKPKIGAYIVNLQNHNIGNGTHWVCFIIFKSKVVYYDSFGLVCPLPVINFVRKYNNKINLIYSIDHIQNIDSVLCGWFVLFFLYFMLIMNKNNRNYAVLVNNHNKLFNAKGSKYNDNILQSLVKNLFQKNYYI